MRCRHLLDSLESRVPATVAEWKLSAGASLRRPSVAFRVFPNGGVEVADDGA